MWGSHFDPHHGEVGQTPHRTRVNGRAGGELHQTTPSEVIFLELDFALYLVAFIFFHGFLF